MNMIWVGFLWCFQLIIQQVSCWNFQCWEESEQEKLTYRNNVNKTIDTLPSIRLFQGSYGSQWVMQYAAYVYLKEQLGVNVSWFPSEDHYSLSNFENYPYYYFTDLANDNVDLLLEIWPVAMEVANSEGWFDNGTVLDGGTSGVYGEIGWFIPQYLADSNPTAIVPYILKYNETLRNNIKYAISNGTNTNWNDKFYEIRNNNFDGYKFDFPNNSNPTVFGSYDSYGMSIYSYDLSKNVFNKSGIGWNFVTFDSESLLSEFIYDMYSHKLPFVANLYSPTVDFATIINETGELMEFQRVSFDRNPSNTVYDECYENAQCRQPLILLNKLGNPRLENRFPEMVDFLESFTMDASDVNEILLYQQTLENEAKKQYGNNLTNDQISQIWANASCIWLKNNIVNTLDWHVDIIRYDCITGCGFNYSYNITHMNLGYSELESIVYINNKQDYIGGTCDETYESTYGKCECDNEYLFGNCRRSCPGLMGPYCNFTKSDNDSDSNNYNESCMFYYCSNHGRCNTETRQCRCERGYGYDDCSYEYPIFKYNEEWTAIFSLLFAAIILLLIFSLLWLKLNLEFATIRALSPWLTVLFTIGMILLAGGGIVGLIQPVSSLTCNLRFYLLNVGGLLVILSPLLKSYRIERIYSKSIKKLENVKITDKQLLKDIFIGVILELIICILFSVFHELNGGIDTYYNDDLLYIEYKCNSSAFVQWLEQANYMIGVILLLIFCYLAVKTRASSKVFKESTCAYFGSFFSLFTFVVVVIFNLISDNADVITTIQSCALAIILIVVWCLFYGVRMYRFYAYPDERQSVAILNKKMTNNPNATRSVSCRTPKRVSSSLVARSQTYSDRSMKISNQNFTKSKSMTTRSISPIHNGLTGNNNKDKNKEKEKEKVKYNDNDKSGTDDDVDVIYTNNDGKNIDRKIQMFNIKTDGSNDIINENNENDSGHGKNNNYNGNNNKQNSSMSVLTMSPSTVSHVQTDSMRKDDDNKI